MAAIGDRIILISIFGDAHPDPGTRVEATFADQESVAGTVEDIPYSTITVFPEDSVRLVGRVNAPG